jgi:hypothetical protein
MNYINTTTISVSEENEQERTPSLSVSGQLWDFWGAGRHRPGSRCASIRRKETTSATGTYGFSTGDRFLFISNTVADFPEASSTTSNECLRRTFNPAVPRHLPRRICRTERLVPLRSTTPRLGKTRSLRRELRVPSGPRPGVQVELQHLDPRAVAGSENFSPLLADVRQQRRRPLRHPSDHGGSTNWRPDIRANRIANCTALVAAAGHPSYDFAGTTADRTDDYNPLYRVRRGRRGTRRQPVPEAGRPRPPSPSRPSSSRGSSRTSTWSWTTTKIEISPT